MRAGAHPVLAGSALTGVVLADAAAPAERADQRVAGAVDHIFGSMVALGILLIAVLAVVAGVRWSMGALPGRRAGKPRVSAWEESGRRAVTPPREARGDEPGAGR